MCLREARFCRYKVSIVNMFDLSSNATELTGSSSDQNALESYLGLLQISMFEDHFVTDCAKALSEPPCNRNRAVAPAGTPNRNGEITALLTLIERDQELQHALQLR